MELTVSFSKEDAERERERVRKVKRKIKMGKRPVFQTPTTRTPSKLSYRMLAMDMEKLL